jgi:hypothetical protein
MAGSAGANDRTGRDEFVANKTFGLGLELGEPVGLSGKVFVAPSHAIDFGIGDLGVYRPYYLSGYGLHVYGDYLWHPAVLTHARSFDLPFYVGLGARYWQYDYMCDPAGCASADLLGLRVPIGAAFDFNHAPLDIFVQLVPTLDFYRQYARDVRLDVDFSAGLRFWFI